MSVTAARIYHMPYRPTVARDLLVECGISQREVAAALGFNIETLRHAINRGFVPSTHVKRDIRQQLTIFIEANVTAATWLREHRLALVDLFRPSANKQRHIYPINHGEKVYYARRHGLQAKSRERRDIRILRNQTERRKKIMENGFATLAQFGYHRNPFEDVHIQTADGNTLKRLFKMATDSNAMVQMIAQYGAGKTTAIEAALEGIECATVMLKMADKERMTIADVERELIRQLSSEPVTRDRGARARQVSRIVGEAARTKPVILIIEESHVMHHSTLRAIKRVREYDWMGKRPLLSVILIGQYDKLKTANLAECHRGMRSDTYKLQGLAPSESRHYINETVGQNFEPEAIKATSDLAEARNFLDLQEALITLMQAALHNGTKMVTVLDVFSTYGGGIKQLMEKYDIKQTQLAEMIGESTTTVSLIVNNKSHTLNKDKEVQVRSAIQDALKTLTQQHSDKKHQASLKAV